MTGGREGSVPIGRPLALHGTRPVAGWGVLRLGSRRVPLFRSFGIVGFYAALPVALVAAFRAGVDPVTALGLCAVAGLSFFVWALLRRRVSGRESLVLLEHVWVAAGAVALYCAASGVDVLAGLDVLVCGIAVFLAFGRAGCFAVGCCHGVPSDTGIAYPVHAGLPPRLTGIPLVPVPLIEAVALLFVAGVAVALAGRDVHGAATVWFLLIYAVVRFGLESLRGDERPRLGGLSLPRWMCLVQGVAGLALSIALLPGGMVRNIAVPLGALTATALMGAVLALRRRTPDLVRSERLDETWATIERLAATRPAADRPALEVTGPGVRYGVSLVPPSVPPLGYTDADGVPDAHVSSSSDRWSANDLVAVADALGATDVRCGERAVHFRIAGARLGLRHQPSGPPAGTAGRPVLPANVFAGPAGGSQEYFGVQVQEIP